MKKKAESRTCQRSAVKGNLINVASYDMEYINAQAHDAPFDDGFNDARSA